MIKRNLALVLFAFIMSLGFQSCQEEEGLSLVPAIEVLSIAPSTAKSFDDEIVIVLSYKDGDGDLGFESGDDYALEVSDSRNGLVEFYYVPPLAPSGSEIAIQGEFKLVIPYTFVFNNMGTDEDLSYTIRLRDRAGNWSNSSTTSSIKVLP